MEIESYVIEFQKLAGRLDKKLLYKSQIEVATGMVMESAYLKLFKTSWASPNQNPLTAESRIFFSFWINESLLKEQKIAYNIHALKLRKLKGYSIESRKFAEIFRNDFKKFQNKWPNVSVKFGPLTLMEGWIPLSLENFQDEVFKLCNEFLKIDYLIDDALASHKR